MTIVKLKLSISKRSVFIDHIRVRCCFKFDDIEWEVNQTNLPLILE